MLELWGLGPDLPVAYEEVGLTARDGTRLSGAYVPGPSDPPSGSPAVLVVPGFAAHRRKPAYARLVAALAGTAAVLVIDLRGHGASSGATTLGEQEPLDVRAGGAWLRRRGHRWVGVVGTSMGGSAALLAATEPVGAFDAVCAISTPAVWDMPSTPALRIFTRIAASAWYRAAAEAVLRVRIAEGTPHPIQPADVVASLAPTPLLVVHGADDHFFDAEQADMLYRAAAEPRTLWVEPPGFGHGEDGLDGVFVEQLAAALAGVVASGSWPSRERSLETAAQKVPLTV
jgi:alpha-beta hydrolase superfamily lysophospholipase